MWFVGTLYSAVNVAFRETLNRLSPGGTKLSQTVNTEDDG